MSAPFFITPPLAFLGGEGLPQWNISFEGLPPAWALALFIVLALGTIVAYWKWTPGVGAWRRGWMAMLRLLAAAVLTGLLARPVLNLTLHEPVRQPLAVLVDASQSMGFADHRERPDDLKRAALATGAIAPDEGLKPALPAGTEQFKTLTRHELLSRLAGNKKLNLWPRLAAQSDLHFYQFGRNAGPISSPVPHEGPFKPEAAQHFFQGLKTDEPQTAVGEALRRVLQEPTAQALGGVLLVTDGGNNSGSSPLEAAQMAREQNVPLFIYGVGVTSPRDVIVQEVTAQKLAFVGERMEVRARVVAHSLEEQKTVATLRANGEPVDEREITVGGEREEEVVFHVSPEQAGVLKLEVSVPVLGEEASKENNIASTTSRVTDSKFHVLLIEQEPRWDFRYLLDYLQRDPRLEVQCVMINGEPGLESLPKSPFLAGLPEARDAYFKSQVLILGDVNPDDLGDERMHIIAEWVEAGGGLIFLAGPNFNPRAYAGTPLEALLPVVPDLMMPKEVAAQRAPEPFQLQLTRLGEASPYLQMDPDPEVNKRIWEEFPGVRWTAPVSRVKPGAEVLLVDSRPERMGRYGMLPVFAMQGYGSGKCVYFGTNETYRWRSRTGEKYYSILWGQIMQTLSLQLLEGASSLTQLKTDRKEYAVGDRVVIAGNAYTEGFAPLIIPTLEGTLKIEPKGEGAKAAEQPLNLPATDRNAFRGEFIASVAGSYSYSTARDPEGVLRFEVVNAQLEQTQAALEEKLLKAMASTAGGQFLREEDLDGLPKLISSRSAKVAIYKRVELFYSAWALTALLSLLFLEWLLRRLNRLNDMSERAAPSISELPAPLARALDRVRTRWLAVRLGEFPVLLVAVVSLAWVLQATADRYLELAWKTRLILLYVNGGVAFILFVFFAIVPWWRRLTRPQAALLVERELPHFRTSLISAVELGTSLPAVPVASRALVRKLLADVSQEVVREDLAPRVVRARRLNRFTWIMILAVAIAGTCFALARPLSPLLLQRILLSHTPLPAETYVVDGTGDLDLVAGADAPLGAQAQGVVPSNGRLVVTYEGGRTEVITIPPVSGQPASFAFTVKNVRQPFSYRFELNDGVGENHRVGVRLPPTAKELRFVQVYPKYTTLPETVMSPANLRLLEGSTLKIEATASSELRGAVLEIKGQDAPVPLKVSGAEKNLLIAELTVPATGWKSFSIHLENAQGESSVNDPVYRVELVSDQPPVATLTLPKKETNTVLAQAKIPVAFKVSDDLGLQRVAFCYRVFRPGAGGALEATDEGHFPFEIAAGEKSMTRTMNWELGRLVPAVSPGCSVNCWVEAEDTHSPKAGKPGVITRSTEKVLVIVTEEQKRQELIEQLGEKAKDLERLYELQRNMNEKTDGSLR